MINFFRSAGPGCLVALIPLDAIAADSTQIGTTVTLNLAP